MRTNQRPASTFRDLTVWRKAHEYVLAVYEFTKSSRSMKLSVFRVRCGVRLSRLPPTLLRGSAGEEAPTKVRFMNIAEGSVEESRYYLILLRTSVMAIRLR